MSGSRLAASRVSPHLLGGAGLVSRLGTCFSIVRALDWSWSCRGDAVFEPAAHRDHHRAGAMAKVKHIGIISESIPASHSLTIDVGFFFLTSCVDRAPHSSSTSSVGLLVCIIFKQCPWLRVVGPPSFRCFVQRAQLLRLSCKQLRLCFGFAIEQFRIPCKQLRVGGSLFFCLCIRSSSSTAHPTALCPARQLVRLSRAQLLHLSRNQLRLAQPAPPPFRLRLRAPPPLPRVVGRLVQRTQLLRLCFALEQQRSQLRTVVRVVRRLLEFRHGGDESKVPTVDYLSAPPAALPAVPNLKRTEANGELRASAGSKPIVQGTSYIDNPMRRLLIARRDQKVVVAYDGASPVSVTFTAASKLIDITLFEDLRDVSVPLALQFEYKPPLGFAPIHEIATGRNTRIKEFHWEFYWFIFNGFRMVDGAKPHQVAAVCKAEANITNTDAGEIIPPPHVMGQLIEMGFSIPQSRRTRRRVPRWDVRRAGCD
ncbi:hypothetical protein B0H16DRAFT_1722093 [Mycena metata]|uniref:Fatty acid synthase meander beta sheet domain-containing protein n=1 Tax=Mycena metata TaxID=1033252 RepID=A0AAD7J773_9AGAR|nr:hypothetical protein B0H16DRAFT_1722093 [Mycena metata]